MENAAVCGLPPSTLIPLWGGFLATRLFGKPNTRSTRPYRASALFYILHMARSCLGMCVRKLSDGGVLQHFKTSEHSGKRQKLPSLRT